MAIPTTGIPVNIPIDQVRAGLLTAMQIGKPADPELQVRFIKKGTGKRYYLGAVEPGNELFPPPEGTLRLDRDGRPLNPNVRMVDDEDLTAQYNGRLGGAPDLHGPDDSI